MTELWRRVVRSPWSSYAAGNVAANAVGAAIVFVILGFAFPVTASAGFGEHRTRTVVVFGAYVLLAAVVGAVLFLRSVGPVVLWRRRGGPPTEAEHDAALRLPNRQLLIVGALWTVGGAVFVALVAPGSPTLAGAVAFTVAMGAAASCSLGYLVAERVLRPVTAAALESAVPVRSTAPGVRTRVLLTWAAGSGVPLVGVVLVGVAQLSGVLEGNQVSVAVPVTVLGGFGLVVGLGAVALAVRAITDPVQQVGRALAEVREGRVNVTVDVYDGSEIGELQVGFNDMVRGVAERERLRDLFGKHVGQDVARRALEHGTRLGGEVREVAVLFIDLVGSTALAAERPPDEVVLTLNEFFRVVVDVVDQHHGFVNKFEGDAALAVFGAPIDHDDAAGAALTAARHLRLTLRDLIDFDFGIGISSGEAVAGNIGAAQRFEYTVIGDPVNEAARLTELAKTRRGRVLASARTVERADPEEADHWKVKGRTRLRGRTTVTRTAEPA
ncbi:adenylate/guanylate cyclase domain-containing protein [Rhodococcus aerolatus]